MEEKFSVWVGSLSLQCQEETLSDFFGKFGPLKSVVICRDELGKSKQFGYVNYFSCEIAECAATVMDNCKILGQAIKTKGPNELQKLKNEQNNGTRKDYRMYTDCLFFIDGRECTWKIGQCLFRHCEAAKGTEMVCEKWTKRQCEDQQCPFRHPRLTKTPALTENTVNRCPSHNAFKCFGECGDEDCNTHFLEHSAYLEHVKMARTKPAQPVDNCTKCQAVFFKQEEKTNHRCYKDVANPLPRSGAMSIQQFTSTRMQAEKDIVQPRPTYPNKTHFIPNPKMAPVPTQHLMKSQTDGKMDGKYSPFSSPKTKQMDYQAMNTTDKRWSSLQNTYNTSSFNPGTSSVKQNSIRTLASNSTIATCWSAQKAFNPNPFNSTNFSSANHVPKACNASLVSTVNSPAKSSRELEPVGVFWDFENCSVPKGKSAQAVVQKIRSVFFKEKREVEFMCVCDTSKEKKSVIEELNKAQVTVVHINATSKNAADDKLRQSLRRFAQTFGRPATVVLISGDGNFAMDLSDLRHRHNFEIICLHNVAASSALLGFAHETHRFDLFTEDLQTFTSGQTPYKPSFSNEILVSNLPAVKNVNVLKARLTKLSDNCGGKVLTINASKAIVRFPNAEAAFRARRRLDKEDLFGNILRATLLPLANNKDGRDATTVKRKVQEHTSPTTVQSSSPLHKSLRDMGLNDTRSFKENQSPNSTNPSRNFPAQNSPPIRFPESRSHTSPQFAQFPGQRFPGHVMFNNMFHPTLLHNMFGLRGGAPPSPVPITTAPSPLSTPTSPLSPVVNSLVRRSPSPEQQYNGVDLLVTNINESVPKKEIKKKLASVFREHCKVYSVVLHAKNGAPLRAFVKVPKLMDAHIAISKVTGKTVFGQVVHVSIASERDKELCYLQDEAVAVLQEAPLSWLPLTTFCANFEKKYRRHLDARHLDQIQDSVVINGSLGCQTISLLEGKIDSQNLLVDNSFALDVFKLLHHYNGAIALVSFPALFWLEFHKEFELCSTGSLLVELLNRIPNVTVVGTANKRSVRWLKKPGATSCESMDLSALSSQLVELLQRDHEFEMTFERMQEKYLECHDKELDASYYGFASLADLFHSLTNILQVKEEVTTVNYVCLVREFRVKLFQKEISELLAQQPYYSVLLSNFMASYVKHFGQKFKLSSFGFTRLTDLIKAVSSVAEIEGVGDQRTVTLVQKKEKELSQKEEFDELLQLDETIYSVDQVKADLITLVNGQENKLVFVKNICKLYENCFCRKFPYDTSLLNEALESLEKPLEIRGSGNDRIVGIFSSTEQENPSEVDFVFVKTAIEILYQREEYTLPRARFERLYHQNLRRNKNIREDDARLECFPSCVVIREEGREEIAELRRSYCIRILVEELKQLLASTDDLSMPLGDLPTQYEEYFEKSFNLKCHGLLCLEDLKDKLIGFIEITSSENSVDLLALSPVSRFEYETKTLLESCGGCLSLSRFAPVYQQMYSKPCIVSDYGYAKLSSLINAIPHVARIIGSGPEKVVIAVQKSIPERVCSDMLSVRIIGGSTEEVFSTKKDKRVSPLCDSQEAASCQEATVSDELNTNLPSPAGQESTELTTRNLPTERLNTRSTPSKIRLAANFKFPLNGSK